MCYSWCVRQQPPTVESVILGRFKSGLPTSSFRESHTSIRRGDGHLNDAEGRAAVARQFHEVLQRFHHRKTHYNADDGLCQHDHQGRVEDHLQPLEDKWLHQIRKNTVAVEKEVDEVGTSLQKALARTDDVDEAKHECCCQA